MTPTFCQLQINCLPSWALTISVTSKSNLLEFLCFCFQNCFSESTLKQWQSGHLFRREKKDQSWLSRGLFVQVYKADEVFASETLCSSQGVWNVTQNSTWTLAHRCVMPTRSRYEREACGAAAAWLSSSTALFCCIADYFSIAGCSLGNFTSTEYALGMGLLCETRWKIMYQIKLDRETCKKQLWTSLTRKQKFFLLKLCALGNRSEEGEFFFGAITCPHLVVLTSVYKLRLCWLLAARGNFHNTW